MERTFKILAVILAGVAAFFLWAGNTDSVFVSVVLGCVSFFLSIRYQIKKRLKQREIEAETETDAPAALEQDEVER